MEHRHQPVTHVGVGEAQHWPGIDHVIDDEDEWEEPNVLSRGFALTRLIILILACGLGAGIVIGVTLALALTGLRSSV